MNLKQVNSDLAQKILCENIKFHMDLSKKERLAVNKIANALIKVWKPARIPLMTKVNVVGKIRSLVKSYRKFKYYKKETSSLVTFRESLKQRLVRAAEDAENRIMKDTDLLPKDKDLKVFGYA